MNISVLGVNTNTNNIISFKFMYFFMLSPAFFFIFVRKILKLLVTMLLQKYKCKYLEIWHSVTLHEYKENERKIISLLTIKIHNGGFGKKTRLQIFLYKYKTE